MHLHNLDLINTLTMNHSVDTTNISTDRVGLVGENHSRDPMAEGSNPARGT